MATTKKRINISVSKEVENALSALAKRDQVPLATKAEALLQMALELEEDISLVSSAEPRLMKGGRIIAHDEAWQ
jgi:predicted DNA-binding protein